MQKEGFQNCLQWKYVAVDASSRAAFGNAKEYRECLERYLELQNAVRSLRVANSAKLTNYYYDIATLFYEKGWGESFHFAGRWKYENRTEAIRRLEYQVASMLCLSAGQVVLDLGCGIGGPMRNIARFARCRIIGVNQNKRQVSRCNALNRACGMTDLCTVIEGDMLQIPVRDGAVDAAYAIEATVHTSLEDVYREVYRVLKAGGLFCSIENALLDAYDRDSATHNKIRRGIEIGAGIASLPSVPEIQKAVVAAGFEILHLEDLNQGKDIPWYAPVFPRAFSVTEMRYSLVVQNASRLFLGFLGLLGVVPKEASAVSKMLREGANNFVLAGEAGIFTPSFCIVCRKRD